MFDSEIHAQTADLGNYRASHTNCQMQMNRAERENAFVVQSDCREDALWL
jgi:hypothetical protein